MRRKLGEATGLNNRSSHEVMDWVSLYAIAVNEENAAGSQVVTAPTNGAAGIVPATLRYYRDHCAGADVKGERCFLLTASAIDGTVKAIDDLENLGSVRKLMDMLRAAPRQAERAMLAAARG